MFASVNLPAPTRTVRTVVGLMMKVLPRPALQRGPSPRRAFSMEVSKATGGVLTRGDFVKRANSEWRSVRTQSTRQSWRALDTRLASPPVQQLSSAAGVQCDRAGGRRRV